MAQHGGYRKPTNPAPVSGPGQHSRRTDGQPSMNLPDAKYGENKDFQEIQQGADVATDPGQQAGWSMPPVTGLGEPSTQPDVPVTSGAQYGAGPGPEALGFVPPDRQDAQWLQRYMPVLVDIADRDDTPPGTKEWVRRVIANS